MPMVNGPDAEQHFRTATLPSGPDLILGKKEDAGADEVSANAIQMSHDTWRAEHQRRVALEEDTSRTEFERHAAAKVLAERLKAALQTTKTTLEQRAEYLDDQALQQMNAEFTPKPDQLWRMPRVLDRICAILEKPSGVIELRKLAAANPDVAAAALTAGHFALGMSPDAYENMRMDVLKARRPDLYGMRAAATLLTRMAPRYEAAIRKVDSTFYSSEVLARAKKRVEV